MKLKTETYLKKKNRNIEKIRNEFIKILFVQKEFKLLIK